MGNLNLIVTEQRVQDVPLEVFYLIEDGSPRILIDYIAHFVADENGEYLPQEKAVKEVVTGRTLGDLEAIASQLKDAVEEGIVPNA